MKCLICGVKYELPDINDVASIHPMDRYCYECYTAIVESDLNKRERWRKPKLLLYLQVYWWTVKFRTGRRLKRMLGRRTG